MQKWLVFLVLWCMGCMSQPQVREQQPSSAIASSDTSTTVTTSAIASVETRQDLRVRSSIAQRWYQELKEKSRLVHPETLTEMYQGAIQAPSSSSVMLNRKSSVFCQVYIDSEQSVEIDLIVLVLNRGEMQNISTLRITLNGGSSADVFVNLPFEKTCFIPPNEMRSVHLFIRPRGFTQSVRIGVLPRRMNGTVATQRSAPSPQASEYETY